MRLSKLHPELLDYFHDRGLESRRQLSDHIWERFGQRAAILVLDMERYSATTRERGIVFYLSMVAKMQTLTKPILEQHGGALLRFEADGCFACFPKVDSALSAWKDLTSRVNEVNSETPEDLNIGISCGIDYGRFLFLGEEEFFGEPVNVAVKLAEEAMAGELVLSLRALEMATDSTPEGAQPLECSISGLTVQAARLRTQAHSGQAKHYLQ